MLSPIHPPHCDLLDLLNPLDPLDPLDTLQQYQRVIGDLATEGVRGEEAQEGQEVQGGQEDQVVPGDRSTIVQADNGQPADHPSPPLTACYSCRQLAWWWNAPAEKYICSVCHPPRGGRQTPASAGDMTAEAAN